MIIERISWLTGRLDATGDYHVLNDRGTRVLGGPFATRTQAGEHEWRRVHRRDAENKARVAHALRGLKQNKRLARRHRMPRAHHPMMIEVDYARSLLEVVASLRRSIAPLLEELPSLVLRVNARRDSTETERVYNLIEYARKRAPARPTIATMVAQVAQRTATYQRATLARQVRAGLGADVTHLGLAERVRAPHADSMTCRYDSTRDVLSNFVGENVALIRSLGDRPLDEIMQLISRGFANGARHETLADEIEERLEVAESRARLIARDQIGKLNGQINASMHKEIGIESFVWRTANDERVRPEHETLDGQQFRYDDPPDEGLPGEPIQCRCYAEPVFTDILDALAQLDPEGG